MKTYLKTTTIVLVILLLCFMGYKVVNKIQQKTKVIETLKTIPRFSFETLDNETFTKSDLVLNRTTVFIYFNTECNYCQNEAISIKQSIDEFKNTQLIFVSSETKETIKTFSEFYKLNTYDYVNFLFDSQDDFSSRFDATSIPYVLIYDENQALVKRHKGQLKAEVILKTLKSNSINLSNY
ncbi:peroxiredoxin [Aquimarina sp. AU474]|uniref:peroxiredoxin family protein n=1 Tax=Aquimarina sp. AU474 TaxID=2108529 RepID=UPI000D690A4E|nr:redoxin domain-containing protein [Aquimarina sp. AU474]